MLIPQKHPIINENPPKRRRANFIEILQRYTKALEEKEAKRPSRGVMKAIDGLRDIRAGIYAVNVKPCAREAAERTARTRSSCIIHSRQLSRVGNKQHPRSARFHPHTHPQMTVMMTTPLTTTMIMEIGGVYGQT